MKDLKELAKNAIIKEVFGNLERYFNFTCFRSDDDYIFRYKGVISREVELEQDDYTIKASWQSEENTLDRLTLFDVEVIIREFNEDGEEIGKSGFILEKL